MLWIYHKESETCAYTQEMRNLSFGDLGEVGVGFMVGVTKGAF